ncbi:helix-turn-helix domain-containing protein [uncultured Amnibacterium sp.]|uniref:AraC family transcriptional regulator n=1 Tax=uncultured Amnibacterium sp. TaxID=1631851 RepID=UPI0035CAE976
MAIDAAHRADDPVHVATTDPNRAAALLGHSFPGIALAAPEDGPGFSFAYDRASDGRLAVHRLRLAGSATADGSMGPGVRAARVRGGRFALEYGRTAIDTAVPYLRPAGRSSAQLQDAHVQLIEIDPQAFAAAAFRHLEGTGRSVRTPSAADAGPILRALLPAWERIADLAVSVAFDDPAFASPLIRAGLIDLVVAGLLATFPLTAETGVAGRHGAGPAAVRRAVAHIDEHLAEPLDVGAIAAAAGLPVRTLQTAFRSQIGVAPMARVRQRRLAAVRDELARAEPGSGVTVAEVAHRWGFAHLARFAEQYRRVYGENPSETLRH